MCGTVSSGGTESILLAMKTYRDRAQAERGVTAPNIVAPVTAHAAFDKASQYFEIELRKAPVGSDFRADVDAMRALVDDQTVAMIGSAVQFPQGVIDPIEDLAAIAADTASDSIPTRASAGSFCPGPRNSGTRMYERSHGGNTPTYCLRVRDEPRLAGVHIDRQIEARDSQSVVEVEHFAVKC